MFRHEEKFHRRCGIAYMLEAGLSDDEFKAAIEDVNARTYVRVGKEIKVDLCAVEVSGGGAADRAKVAAELSKVPIVLMSEDAGAMAAAAAAIKDKKPLVYRATPANMDEFIKIAAEHLRYFIGKFFRHEFYIGTRDPYDPEDLYIRQKDGIFRHLFARLVQGGIQKGDRIFAVSYPSHKFVYSIPYGVER